MDSDGKAKSSQPLKWTARDVLNYFFPYHGGHTITNAVERKEAFDLQCSCGELLLLLKATITSCEANVQWARESLRNVLNLLGKGPR